MNLENFFDYRLQVCDIDYVIILEDILFKHATAYNVQYGSDKEPFQ